MTEKYTQDDPRIKPLPLSTYPFTPLPHSLSSNDIVKLSIIPTTSMSAPRIAFTPAAEEGEMIDTPSWSFLVEKGDWAGMFDLGLRVDVENEPKTIVDGPLKEFIPHGGKGPIQRLREGNFDLERIKCVMLSHQHFDLSPSHLGRNKLITSGDLDTLPHPVPIILGPDSLESIGPGYPHDPNSAWPAEWLKKYHFVELPAPSNVGDAQWKGEVSEVGLSGRGRKWEEVGCFENGVDWFGDGSFWLIDTPGHTTGHLMALARVTANPDTYVLLGGDASHSQDLYLPIPTESEDKRNPLPAIDGKVSLAIDPAVATYTIGQMTRMSAEENIMVILAHEMEVEGVVDFWPGDLSGWKEKGWKEEKEKGLAK